LGKAAGSKGGFFQQAWQKLGQKKGKKSGKREKHFFGSFRAAAKKTKKLAVALPPTVYCRTARCPKTQKNYIFQLPFWLGFCDA
jgi:hypothetical protein